ncbi:MAG: NAD(P)-dependent oxidoreductase [Thaumarchaeota archaeon]|nr:NAD(P)-dependent oxidoreductase [Nitrososphaerota archaeon]
MKAKIAITGANGTIGTVMRKALTDYDIVPLDLPQVDVRDYNVVLQAIKGCRAVIHLAWNVKDDNWETGRISPDNDVMTFNVYEACFRGGVPRAIMASSVHADNFMKWNGKALMNTTTVPIPTSPYGANKVFMEALGRFYAQVGLEVVCIRFGSVSKEDVPGTKGWDWRKVWLSHRDLASMVRRCLEVEKIPNNYAVFYAVSNNALRVHDWDNPLNWAPVDDAFASKNNC